MFFSFINRLIVSSFVSNIILSRSYNLVFFVIQELIPLIYYEMYQWAIQPTILGSANKTGNMSVGNPNAL